MASALGCAPDEPAPSVVEVGVSLVRERLAVGGYGSYHSYGCVSQGGAVTCWSPGWPPDEFEGSEWPALGRDFHGDPPLPPVALGQGVRAQAVVAGQEYTCVITHTGRVKCWGLNEHGQLGLGDTIERGWHGDQMSDGLPHVELGTDQPVAGLALGHAHTCALFADGKVKCWGLNEDGQLGLGDTQTRGDEPGEMGATLPFVELPTDARAVAIDAGMAHTCALLDDGAIVCWGEDTFGQLGTGKTTDVEVERERIEDIRLRGNEPGEMGDALMRVDLGGDGPAIGLATGDQHTCAVLDGGRAKCWGRNHVEDCNLLDPFCLGIYYDRGRLGTGDHWHKSDGTHPPIDLGTDAYVLAIQAASKHTCALLEGGRIKCWGYHGVVIGQPITSDDNGNPHDVGDDPEEMGDALPYLDFGEQVEATAFSSEWRRSCILTKDERVMCWGANHGMPEFVEL